MANDWDFAPRTTKRSFHTGVYKHRSLEEAERLREVSEEKNPEPSRERIRVARSDD